MPEAESAAPNVVDLMAALKASLSGEGKDKDKDHAKRNGVRTQRHRTTAAARSRTGHRTPAASDKARRSA